MLGETHSSSHVVDLIPAYVLGVLEAADARQVSDHLVNCADCAAEHRAYSEVIEKLPLAVPQVNPPPRLRAAILQQARRSRQPDSGRSSWLQDLIDIFRKPGLVWMAASLGAILILAIGNLYQWRLSSQPASPTPAYHFNVVAMVADDPAAEAEGVLVISPDGRYGTLVVDGLQPLVAGQEYQLWLIIGDSRVSGGVFSVGSSGYGALKVEAPRPLSEYNRFGITIEPVGGSPQPTGKRVLGSAL